MPAESLSPLLEKAINHHKSGQTSEAAALYRDILSNNPDDIDANYLLGLILLDQGDASTAIGFLQVASSNAPLNSIYQHNLGRALAALNRPEEAESYYRQAVAIDPNYIDAQFALALSLQNRENYAGAVTQYQKLIAIAPHIPLAYNNLGNALSMLRRYPEAIANFQKALAIDPNASDVYSNLGNVYTNAGMITEAEQAYVTAIEKNASDPNAHFNLGNLYFQQFNYDKAIEQYEKTLKLQPDFIGAHNNLGNLLCKHGRLSEANEHLSAAIKLDPQAYEAINNLGNVYSSSGDIEQALPLFRKAVEICPDYKDAYSNLLYSMQYPANISDAEIATEHQRWAQHFAQPITASESLAAIQSPTQHKQKIRIGYVSGDFRRHSVAYFFEPLLKAHNRNEFEIYCYSNVLTGDSVTEKLINTADHWRDITGINDAEAAQLIKQDGIDILVDLAGHTDNNRLLVFAYRPAPMQVSWLGYPNTTGLSVMDYRITDNFADPSEDRQNDALYSEKLIRLPQSFLCYEGDSSELAAPEKNTQLPLTFGSFNNLTKINDDVIKLWSDALIQFAGSHLILKSHQLEDEAIKQKTLDRFAKHGIDAERIELVARIPSHEEHLAFYKKIDIALDTFPYNGTTTTFEALWMGVPVVTLAGSNHRSRVSESILSNLGHTELVAHSNADFLDILSRLNVDREQLYTLKTGLRPALQQSPLTDSLKFAQQMETAFHAMLTNPSKQ